MIEEWASSYVGTRYFAALPAEDVSNLPTPARAAIHSSIYNFLTQDRGHVRQGNDGTADSRFVFFFFFFLPAGLTECSLLSSLQPP
jgi:hypothetical protein